MVTMAHTSVPSWALRPQRQPAGPEAARAWVLTFDCESAPETWIRELTSADVPHDVLRLSDASAEQIIDSVTRLAAEATVGGRLLLHGPVAEVLTARAAALDLGFLDGEILVWTTAVETIPLFCVHCQHQFLVQARIDDVVPCGACGTELVIYYHLSRRQGSLMGFKHNAEAWPPHKPADSTPGGHPRARMTAGVAA